jgi:hypothetical protein
MGDGQLDPAPWIIETATDVLRMCVFDALTNQPALNLIIGDDRGLCSLGNVNGVSYMIAVSVGYQDIIGLNLIGFGGCQGIVAEKGIDQQTGLPGLDEKTGMTKPGNFDSHLPPLRLL